MVEELRDAVNELKNAPKAIVTVDDDGNLVVEIPE